MEKNIYDRVIEKLSKRNKLVKDKLQKQFARQTPFRMEPLTDKKLEEIYDNMGEQDWYDALDKFGPDQVNAFKNRVDVIKMRRDNARTWSKTNRINPNA